MAESRDCGGQRQGFRKTSRGRVKLEKVLGVSTSSSGALASDPNSGLVAYPAGCVVVLLHPQLKTQRHIINTSRKPFSALAFSGDGKHLVTGESGHLPRVRVWQVDGGAETTGVQNHKFAVSCVAFSPDGAYVVSVGSANDATVCVWDWRRGSILASNKVSSDVSAVSFSEDGGYFVTAGKRHVKFWYLDISEERRVNGTVPLMGRSGLLGERHEDIFCGVACGRGPTASSTYAVTETALLCRFDAERRLEARVRLEAACARSLAAAADFVFCGCSDGAVHVLDPVDLRYLATLPCPHHLGAELTSHRHLDGGRRGPYPDAAALTFDPAARHLTCVYSDRSVYVWDVSRPRSAAAVYSAVYHAAAVWNVQVCPSPSSSFLTCSSDGTVRQWLPDLCGKDLLRSFRAADDRSRPQAARPELRALAVSPDGRRLATGDRCGILRIYDWEFLEELVKIEAHDSEILALEFSPMCAGEIRTFFFFSFFSPPVFAELNLFVFWSGANLLASAGRDRLIRVFNADAGYRLEQTLGDHSAAVLAVKIAGDGTSLRMVSCGTDKSVYFYSWERTGRAGSFRRTRHLVEKTAPHDMDLAASGTHVAVACQDRMVRVYDVKTGKLSKCLKDTSGCEGAPLKVHADPSGSLLATGCSDKNVHIFEYRSGERLATLAGHSEPVTALRFGEDRRYLTSASGDGCVLVWRLDPRAPAALSTEELAREKSAVVRRETFIVGPAPRTPELPSSSSSLLEPEGEGPPSIRTNGKMPAWFRKLQGEPLTSTYVPPEAESAPVRNRWLENSPLVVLPAPANNVDDDDDDDFYPQTLEGLLTEDEDQELESAARDGDERTAAEDVDGDAPVGTSPDSFRADGAEADAGQDFLLRPPLAVCRRFLSRYGHRLR
ncbi:WD repeat-containing protein 62 isoform X1 [Corythoichthys intestinalis]|uniref:WD repeat-containing protein 62 isoform X1 n=1 Tax=Corythoichthys intestinalis TaxID=161448 RepID=UPI0025A5566E|nr:WD repeat-containing protein 62 isoform X1 [Corythoichthys intestinalis]